jgi:hypothetical protein
MVRRETGFARFAIDGGLEQERSAQYVGRVARSAARLHGVTESRDFPRKGGR